MICTSDRIGSQPSDASLYFVREVASVATTGARLATSIVNELSDSGLDPGERRRLRALLHGLESSVLGLLVWSRRFEQGILPR
jgi:hypothetical protein